MAYQHTQLGLALGWAHPATPRIMTTNGVLTQWPVDLLPQPSEAEQAQVVSDYLAYVGSTQHKDDEWQAFLDSLPGKAAKTLALVGVDKGLWTVAELKAKWRTL